MTCLIMTLEEMLRLALGTTTPDQTNMEILHSFLKILINKLDIQNDFVEITGPSVADLREMLCQSNNPIMDFKTYTEKCPEDEKCYTSQKVDKMEYDIVRLTCIVNKMEAELKAHLEALDKCKLAPAASRLKLKKVRTDLKMYDGDESSDCDNLCDPCDEKNLIACDLLQNPTFLKRLMRRVTSPVIDRIFEFENLIGIINEKFQKFLNLAEDEFKKIPLIEDCLLQLAALYTKIEKHEQEFITTMEEIQDILDSKVDKSQMPPFKRYLEDRMSEIERQLIEILRREECPKAAAVIMNQMQCLCCETRVCQRDRVYPVPLLGNVLAGEKGAVATGRLPRLCIPGDRERACGGDHTVIRPGEKSLQKTNLIDDFGDKFKLRIGNKLEFFKGTDGGMYRLAPDVEVPCKGSL